MCVELPCGYSSQTLAKLVAYADILFSVSSLAIFILLWGIISASSLGSPTNININTINSTENVTDEIDELFNRDFGRRLADSLFTPTVQEYYVEEYKCLFLQREGFLTLLILLGISYCIGTFVLALILLSGAQRRNHITLKRWLGISVLLWFVRVILVIVWIVTGPPESDFVGPVFIGFFNCFYNGIVMSLVHNLIRHIEVEGVILYSNSRKKKHRLY